MTISKSGCLVFLVCLRVEMVRGRMDVQIFTSSYCDQEQNLEKCLDLRDNFECVFSDEVC